jgi:hypothetical protein
MNTIFKIIFYIYAFVAIIGILVRIISIPVTIKILKKNFNNFNKVFSFSLLNPFKDISGKKYRDMKSGYKFLWVTNLISNISFVIVIAGIISGFIFVILRACSKLL